MINLIKQFFGSISCQLGFHKGEWKSYKNGLQLLANYYRNCERCNHYESTRFRNIDAKAIYQLEKMKRDNPNKSFDLYGEEVKKEDDYIDMINKMNNKIIANQCRCCK